MTVYNKASLVLAESPAYKAGKIQPYYPLTPDVSFDFTRATSATRVNASGNIEKETQNLLLQSNQFDTTWTTSNASVTSGQSGYDGSTDAWLLEADSDGSGRRVQQSKTQGGVATLSIYAKAGTTDWLRIEFGGAASLVYFDLTNGVLGSETNAIGKIESVGNGWYRCSAVNTSGSTPTTMRYHLASDNNNITAVTGDNIYIQDAQLEQGLVARNYQETTTAAFYGGITDNIPRLDYTDGSCPSVLLEPQRTNLFAFANSYDFKLVRSTRGDAANRKGVDGFLYSDNGEGNPNINDNKVTYSQGYHTMSLIVDSANSDYFQIHLAAEGSAGNGVRARFVPSTKTWENTSENTNWVVSNSIFYDHIDLGNGIFRLIIGADFNNATATYYFPVIYYGTDNSNVFIGGLQLEQGSYATSYIPTYGTSVTRNGDFCTKTDATSLIGQTEGTIFLDLNVTTIDSSGFLFGIYGGSPRNEIYFRGQANNSIGFIHYNVNTQAYIVTSSLSEGRHKLAACYKNNDWVLYLDGTLVAGDTSGSFTGGANNISFGYSSSGVYEPYESVNQALVFKTRLSNDELAALTTL